MLCRQSYGGAAASVQSELAASDERIARMEADNIATPRQMADVLEAVQQEAQQFEARAMRTEAAAEAARRDLGREMAGGGSRGAVVAQRRTRVMCAPVVRVLCGMCRAGGSRGPVVATVTARWYRQRQQ